MSFKVVVRLDRTLLAVATRRGAIAGAATGTAYGSLLFLVGAVPGVLVGALAGTAMGLAVGLLLMPFRGRIKRLWLASGIATLVVSLVLSLAHYLLITMPRHLPPGIRTEDALFLLIPVGLGTIGAIAARGLRITESGKVTPIYVPGPPAPKRPDLPTTQSPS